MAARLQKHYRDTVIKQLKEKFNYQSVMEVPRILMITVNMGLGEAAANGKIIEDASLELAAITGQKPVTTKARKSIAGFKIRKGWPIGCKVTLRGERMYEFLERLIHIAIPRIRDFRGFRAKAFDGQGNYSFGLKEQVVFPEISHDNVAEIRGLDITITTTAKNNEEGKALLAAFNFPFRD